MYHLNSTLCMWNFLNLILFWFIYDYLQEDSVIMSIHWSLFLCLNLLELD